MKKIEINISGDEQLASTLGTIIHDALSSYNINNVLTAPVTVEQALQTTKGVIDKKCFKQDFEESDVNISVNS